MLSKSSLPLLFQDVLLFESLKTRLIAIDPMIPIETQSLIIENRCIDKTPTATNIIQPTMVEYNSQSARAKHIVFMQQKLFVNTRSPFDNVFVFCFLFIVSFSLE